MWQWVVTVCFVSVCIWFDKILDYITETEEEDTPLLIGICGSIGSGKTTFARLLRREYRYEELSFAQPLKEMAKVLGFKVDTQTDKKTIHSYWNISSRQFLRLWGTEICRQYLPKVIPEMFSLWIQYMEMKLQEIWRENPTQRVVISDVRFIDEAAVINKYNGILIQIQRSDAESNNSNHESDKPIPHELVHLVICNDTDPEDMLFQFQQFIGRV